jgi:uncharacterized protein YjcR
MTDAQMAFLAERRRARELEQQQNERSNNALPAESPGNGSAKYNGYGAFLDDNDDAAATGGRAQSHPHALL